MEQLASLEPDQLLQVLVVIGVCALALVVLIAGYLTFVVRTNRRKAKAEALAVGETTPMAVEVGLESGLDERLALLGDPNPQAATDEQTAGPTDLPLESEFDVTSRLSGVGRDAWASGIASAGREPPAPPGETVLRLTMAPDGDRFWVEAAGDRLHSLNDVRDRAVAKRILQAVTWALRFSRGLSLADDGVKAIKLPPTESVPVPATFGDSSLVPEMGEIFRLCSQPSSQEFWVQVNNVWYRSLAEVQDKQVGMRILEGITRLLQFSRGSLASDEGVSQVAIPSLGVSQLRFASLASPPQAPQPAAAEPESAEVSADTAAQREAQEKFIQSLIEQNQRLAAETAQPVGRRLRPVAVTRPSEEPSTFNLVGDVDRIFQGKLAASPLADVDAAIVCGPEGAVRIRVGAKYYEAPDDVPDERLRRIIKAAIAEW